MTKERTYSPALICGHCLNKTVMDIVATRGAFTDLSEGDPSGPILEGYYYQLLVCPACDKINLGRYYHADYLGDDNDTEVTDIVYPQQEKAPTALPPPVMSAYRAALKVRGIDVNAYAVLLGRVLEILCDDRKAAGKTLFNKLEDLGNRGEIPRPLVEMAHSLRQLRNVGAHANLGELTINEIPFLDDLCRAILEYVYSAPDLMEKAKNRLDKIKQGGTASP